MTNLSGGLDEIEAVLANYVQKLDGHAEERAREALAICKALREAVPEGLVDKIERAEWHWSEYDFENDGKILEAASLLNDFIGGGDG